MSRSRFSISRLDAGLLAAACLLMGTALAAGQLPLQPPKEAGEAITPAYEGWFPNEDGSYSLLIGYFNRNTKQIIDIPIGPNNRIEPGGPDLGQPTHFLLRRQWGVFTIRVPADFGTKKHTWTIVANGKPASIPLGLTKDYQLEPYKEVAQGNTPPKIKFAETGKEFTGPPRNGVAATMTATVGTPLTLAAWVTDDLRVDPDDTLTPPAAAAPPAAAPPAAAPPGATPPAGTPPAAAGGRGGAPGGRGGGRGGFGAQPPVRLVWSKYRGPGDVTFENATPTIDSKAGGKTSTTVTFSAPGEYWLRAQVNDRSGDGGGGFQCCWTNAHVKVTVTGAATSK